MTDKKPIGTITHDETRANIPTAELESVMHEGDKAPIKVAYERRNRDLDPQLIWRGKDINQAELTVDAPPIYMQEQVHPKALIDDLRAGREKADDLFGHFGLTDEDREAEVEFYRHSRKWSNRMILGDGLQVMSSLSEREGLRGQVQAIYIDPPYGIKFNSNFQWSTTSRDVKDGKKEHLTREPEQVKAFRDTWRDGIHSYLSYLRDRLVVARELLTESGSCFVQIGDENVHRVRALMDEVFGDDNFVSEIAFKKTGGQTSNLLPPIADYIVWFAKDRSQVKYRQVYKPVKAGEGHSTGERYDQLHMKEGVRVSAGSVASPPKEARYFRYITMSSNRPARDHEKTPIEHMGRVFLPPANRTWTTTPEGMGRLKKAQRVHGGHRSLNFAKFLDDYPAFPISNLWDDVIASGDRWYVVQTGLRVIERCLLMATDPGDLVLDPTCGSGTTATVAEQWGRRWITIDTSRVALALARARIMGAKYPWYLLSDSREGQKKEAEVTRTAPATTSTHNDIRHGFVYNRVPHITLKSIANNTEIDTIWEQMQPAVEEALRSINNNMDTFPCRHPVETGGRKGNYIDFIQREDVTLPSGEEIDGGDFLEWEVPRAPSTPMEGEVLRLWKQAVESKRKLEKLKGRGGKLKVSDEQLKKTRHEFEEWLESLNDAIEDPNYTHLGRKRTHHYFTEEDLESHLAPDGAPNLPWPGAAATAHEQFWQARIARQKEIDASIAAKAEFEYLYDKPYEDKKRVRVAGPFTVESLSPHRMSPVDEHGELIDEVDAARGNRGGQEQEAENYRKAIIENLAKAGVQQIGKEDAIKFDTLTPWPGDWIAAEGRYMEGETERRAGIFIGPEYGTVSRADLVDTAREAADAGFDIVIACAFNFEAMAQEFHKLGRIPILHARMNADLHMAGDLKAGGGNLFVVFGEPDIDLQEDGDKLRVELLGVDIFKPSSGEVMSSEAADIACWFIDTDYSGESFFVRQAYFPGADVPYKALRTTLKGEIDEDAWDSLKRTVSRPFARPKSGRIAVKVINHLGDEVMKVLGV